MANGHGGARAGAGKGRGRTELANGIRKAMRGAIDDSAAKGRPLRVILGEELTRDPLRFLEVVSRFAPRNLVLSDTREISQILSAAEIAEIDTMKQQAERVTPVNRARGEEVHKSNGSDVRTAPLT